MRKRALMAAGAVGVLGASGGLWLLSGADREGASAGTVITSGRLEGTSVRVSAEIGGRITRLSARLGDIVAVGDPIAELDRRSSETAVAAARAAVAAAEAAKLSADARIAALEAQLGLADTEAVRYRRLFARDAAPRQAIDRAEAEQASLEAQVRAATAARALAARHADLARAELEAAELQLEKTVISVPVAGRVTTLIARAGETVTPGGPVVEIVSTEPMKLKVYLPLESAGALQIGDEARVYVDAYPDRAFPGSVSWVADEAEFTPKDVHMPDERSTLVYAVELQVPNPEGRLKDGFPADAYIRLDAAAPWPERRPWR